ncbi:hypothetical protein FVEN_g3776 [Fusarium venenatum]|uniref:Secreted protein n=1 Tax=Fusarium venenatum TaxID=56646 RepID=A0A2L2TKU5_9HYPO|nr:uncharacterized protein FVRRES_13748 [Fusarium venenatum]KAG8358516.1 hypothetical protein FVEN_g3776 [Fusarium venenatum]KAH6980256.1 hypothetical protein EDB82DRAFT_578392 [Fusarium venenatum]CEI41799.1 unnamed protein product [Fusarium venenatum]
MYFSYLLLTAFLATFSTVNGECHRSGETWGGDKFAALEAAQRLCEDGTLGNIPYSRDAFRTACVNLSSKKKVDFTIIKGSNIINPTHLSSNICTAMLHKEINGCEHGGRSPQWENDGTTPQEASPQYDISSDPNAGQCA